MLCEEIASGKALKDVCLMSGMPKRPTVYQWFSEYPEFKDMYTRAREERADLLADEILLIADTEDDPNKARVRIDARKWWAAKVNPKSYGDKADLNVSGDHQHNHTVGSISDSAIWLAKLLGAGTDSETPKPLPN